MASLYEIPLRPQNQSVTVALSGVSYRLTVQWREEAKTWFLDIADAGDTPLAQGLPLVLGANLLHQYQYLGIGGGLVVVCDAGTDAPTFDNLGQSAHLLYVVTP